jgi:hypothetical protein
MIMDIKDTRLRRLYEYWLQRKGGRRFPSRRDIDPVEIRYVLGWVMLIDAMRDPVRFRVRLHGTEMATQAHYDLTGKFIDELPLPEFREYAIGQCKRLIDSGEPLLVHHNRMLDQRSRKYEALWLPFSEDDSTVTTLLCALIYDSEQPQRSESLRHASPIRVLLGSP